MNKFALISAFLLFLSGIVFSADEKATTTASGATTSGATATATTSGTATSAAVKAKDNSIPEFILEAYVKLDPDVRAAIRRGQTELAKRQLSDGSWGHSSYATDNTGVIAFSIMALMIDGMVPGEGDFSKNVSRGVQFLLNIQRSDGLITGSGGNTMYQHALATLALSEVYGMTRNPRVRTSLIKAVNLIVNTQHTQGGWRYDPKPEPGDISITVMQVMALRSAADAGIYVPERTFRQAIRFIKSCCKYDTAKQMWGYVYMANESTIGFSRTAAGIVSMQSVGLQDDATIKKVLPYLMKESTNERAPYYWYGHYYASVALYHYGGQEWQTYYPMIKKKIMADWKMNKDKGIAQSQTLDLAWQIMVLGVPYRYLPIYQR